MRHVVDPVVPKHLVHGNGRHGETRFLLNPSGSFTVGGPAADAGLTGRKSGSWGAGPRAWGAGGRAGPGTSSCPSSNVAARAAGALAARRPGLRGRRGGFCRRVAGTDAAARWRAGAVWARRALSRSAHRRRARSARRPDTSLRHPPQRRAIKGRCSDINHDPEHPPFHARWLQSSLTPTAAGAPTAVARSVARTPPRCAPAFRPASPSCCRRHRRPANSMWLGPSSAA
jgi:hypothetical protein